MKYRVVQRGQTQHGIPLVSAYDTFETETKAVEYVVRYCGGDAETIESLGIEIWEIPE